VRQKNGDETASGFIFLPRIFLFLSCLPFDFTLAGKSSLKYLCATRAVF
jgi:hypothetical protein